MKQKIRECECGCLESTHVVGTSDTEPTKWAEGGCYNFPECKCPGFKERVRLVQLVAVADGNALYGLDGDGNVWRTVHPNAVWRLVNFPFEREQEK